MLHVSIENISESTYSRRFSAQVKQRKHYFAGVHKERSVQHCSLGEQNPPKPVILREKNLHRAYTKNTSAIQTILVERNCWLNYTKSIKTLLSIAFAQRIKLTVGLYNTTVILLLVCYTKY